MTDEERTTHNEREIAELRVHVAILATKQDEVMKKLDKFIGFYTWAGRIIGAAFLVSVYTWITGGGFNR